jgi:hypothetical protein
MPPFPVSGNKVSMKGPDYLKGQAARVLSKKHITILGKPDETNVRNENAGPPRWDMGANSLHNKAHPLARQGVILKVR